MFPTHNFFLLDLVHGFHDISSKLETNRLKSLILRSTLFLTFLQKLEAGQKNYI